MGLIFSSEQDRKFRRVSGVETSKGPIHHVGNHEVRKCRYDSFGGKKYKWTCWRCENTEEEPNDFRDLSCHNCTCEFCDRK